MSLKYPGASEITTVALFWSYLIFCVIHKKVFRNLLWYEKKQLAFFLPGLLTPLLQYVPHCLNTVLLLTLNNFCVYWHQMIPVTLQSLVLHQDEPVLNFQVLYIPSPSWWSVFIKCIPSSLQTPLLKQPQWSLVTHVDWSIEKRTLNNSLCVYLREAV